MSFIKWTNKMNVQIPEMDRHNKKLAELINQLHDATTGGEETKEVGAALESLLAHTREQFSSEEELMTKQGYGEIDTHTAEHREFSERVAEMQSRFESGESLETSELSAYMRDWMLEHIEHQDRKYGEHMTATKAETPSK